jgi:hypothetical protein
VFICGYSLGSEKSRPPHPLSGRPSVGPCTSCGPAPTAQTAANGSGLKQTSASGDAACEALFKCAPRPLPILGRSWRAFLGPGGRRPDAEAWLATPSPIRRARRGPQRRLVINKNTQNATAEGDGILPCPFAAMTVLQNDGLIRGRSAPSVFTPASVGCLVCPSENGSEQPIIEHGGWPRR